MKIIVAFIPVLHAGYLQFLRTYANSADTLLFLGEEFVKDSYLRKEIRMLADGDLQRLLSVLGLFPNVGVCNTALLAMLNTKKSDIVMPDEDITREVAKQYLSDCHITFDSVFLRWHRENYRTAQEVNPDEILCLDTLDTSHVIRKAKQLADQVRERSSDWWRQVGAVLIRNGEIVFAFSNRHMPSAHTPYVHGDPRNCAHQGVDIEIASALHAERMLIAEAARLGIKTDGCDVLVTTFPCPTCAKLILQAGIRNLYFFEGYGVLDAEWILRSKVRIIKIVIKSP